MENLLQIDERLKTIESLLSLQKNVLTIDEVVLLTNLSKSHIYKLTCSNQIPYYKKSKHLFFDRQEVETWLKEHRHSTSSEIESKAANYLLKTGGSK